jgi:cation:H+ antiporter
MLAMHPLVQNIGLLAGGIVLLLFGGKALVTASVDTARRLSVPPLLVGLTLVAWGTSAPELALNVVSAFKGRSELAFGNIVGANICNMGLVIGVCALIRALKVEQRIVSVESILNAVLLCGLAALTLMTDQFTRVHAAIVLGMFLMYSVWTIVGALAEASRQRAMGTPQTPGTTLVPTTEPEGYPTPPAPWWQIGLYFVAGLGLLSVGGSLASDAAVGIATAIGIPSAIVAVTVVSIGTTLPEMFTGVLAVRRGQIDLAMGNAMGSCIFNAGAIFGIAGLIAPMPTPTGAMPAVLTMALLAVMLVPISRTFNRHVARIEGAVLLGVYVVFLGVQAWIATRGS